MYALSPDPRAYTAACVQVSKHKVVIDEMTTDGINKQPSPLAPATIYITTHEAWRLMLWQQSSSFFKDF